MGAQIQLMKNAADVFPADKLKHTYSLFKKYVGKLDKPSQQKIFAKAEIARHDVKKKIVSLGLKHIKQRGKVQARTPAGRSTKIQASRGNKLSERKREEEEVAEQDAQYAA